MKATLFSLLLSTAATLAFAETPLAQPKLLAQIVVPSGLSIEGVGFGGISDLTYDKKRDIFYAISDDRIQHGPARYYELAFNFEDGVLSLNIDKMIELTDENGASFTEKDADPEGIAFAPEAKMMFWSSERDAEGMPAIYSISPEQKVTKIELPEAYLPTSEETGIYSNLAFEGLDLSQDEKTLYVATENALAQDGEKATLESGSKSRIMLIDTKTQDVKAEYFYITEPISNKATQDPFWNDNGISAIKVLEDGKLVVVERSFALGIGNHIRFYIADLSNATDITQNGIEGAEPAEKTLWFEINEGDYGLDIDNIESIEFGTEINGEQSFLIASDDNFNPKTQFTQFVLFSIPKP